MRDFEEQLASQRVAVGVQAIGEQPHNDVPDFDGLARHDSFAFDHANDEAGQIIFALSVEAGHLGRLAANQGAAIVLAGLSQAFDYFLRHFGLKLAGGQVVHEEQRRGALHRDVVDAMVDQVAAHGVVNVHLEGDFELCAHTIDARDQHGIEIFLGVDGKQATEPADLA